MRTTTFTCLLPLFLAPVLGGCPGEDTPTFEPWILDPLPADEGFSIRTPTFDVPAGAEIQDCYFFEAPDLNNGEDYWVNRTVTAINPGSHHMNVFRVKTIFSLDPADGEPVDLVGQQGTVVVGDECWNSAAWADWPLVANSQNSDPEDPVTDWILPEGVASRITPGEMMMLQIHYVNATTQETPFQGRVGVNFHLSPVPDPIELGTLFATQQSIRICRSNPSPSYQGTCALPGGAERHIIAANGHFHSRGRRFQMFTWDGMSDVQPPEANRFYESTNWDDPPMTVDIDYPVNDGGGIWWTCDYQWFEPEIGCDAVNAADAQGAGDCCFTFGSEVETNEHCNAFVYYWPKANTDVFCN